MTLLFRRPFMVESTRRLYSHLGQSDPTRATFADIDDARVYAMDCLYDGLDVMSYKRADNGEWEEYQ